MNLEQLLKKTMEMKTNKLLLEFKFYFILGHFPSKIFLKSLLGHFPFWNFAKFFIVVIFLSMMVIFCLVIFLLGHFLCSRKWHYLSKIYPQFSGCCCMQLKSVTFFHIISQPPFVSVQGAQALCLSVGPIVKRWGWWLASDEVSSWNSY